MKNLFPIEIEAGNLLWQAPEDLPAQIIRIMPNDLSARVFEAIMKKEGIKDSLALKEDVLMIVNARRQNIYAQWKDGFFERQPELLKREPECTVAEIEDLLGMELG